MADPYADCKQVSIDCPVSASTFAMPRASPVGLAVFYRTISFGIVVVLGCAMEVAGYIGRIMLHKNVWGSGMSLQAIMLVLAPSFLAAGIFLTLKHVVTYLGPEHSRLPPKAWVWIFVGCDVIAVVLQGLGGGLSSGADTVKMVNTGNDIMVAGLIFGVIVQALCLLLALDFGYSLRKHRSERIASYQKSNNTTKRFRFYILCTSSAFMFIWIRCIYRVPELVGGWGNPRMKKEAEFMVLDGMMIALACILMTIAHPGIFFPETSRSRRQSKGSRPSVLSSGEEMEIAYVGRE